MQHFFFFFSECTGFAAGAPRRVQRTVARVWRWAWCVSSCAYTTNWNLLLNPRLLKAAHAVNTPSIWPNQCATVDHRLVMGCVTAADGCCIQVLWEKNCLVVFKTSINDLEVFKYRSYLETLVSLSHFFQHLANISELTTDQMLDEEINYFPQLLSLNQTLKVHLPDFSRAYIHLSDQATTCVPQQMEKVQSLMSDISRLICLHDNGAIC